MENVYVKKITGKNQNDFEFAANHIINDGDIIAFKALVEKSDFLFDFIKENVKNRLSKYINKNNYKNLLAFLNVYSSDYEDLLVSTFVKFADEDLTDNMLDLLENGSVEQKAYAAKYFSKINDTLSLEYLKKYSYSDFTPLAVNCAEALAAMNDEISYNIALQKLNSSDDFEILSAVQFLVSYKNKNALKYILQAMTKSSMPENIAAEIPYLQNLTTLLTDYQKYDINFEDIILLINYIILGLGEIISLSQVFDFELYEVLEILAGMQNENCDSKVALCLLNALQKLEQLTENDEYLFDEDKSVKVEVGAIKNMLCNQNNEFWKLQKLAYVDEININSKFVFSALELAQNIGDESLYENLNLLLDSNNQTVILKTVEVFKSLKILDKVNKNDILKNISDENIKIIINSIFS